MGGNIKNKLFLICFFVFLFLPNLITAAVINDGGDYAESQWISEKSVFYLPEDDVYTLSSAANPDFLGVEIDISDYYILVSSKKYTMHSTDSRATSFKYMGIEKSNPLRAVIISATVPRLEENITISDPQNFAPKPIRYITKGNIWGKVFPYPSAGDWASDPNDYLTKVRVKLKYEDPLTKAVYDIDERSVEGNVNDGFHFLKMTIGDPGFNDGKKLPEGRYRLYYRHDEGANCQSGDAAQGFDVKSAVIGCDVIFYGVVNFDLTFANIGGSQYSGSGMITLVGNSTENENNSPADGKTTVDITSPENGIYLDVIEEQQNPFQEALREAIRTMLTMIVSGIEIGGQWINGILNYGNDLEDETGVIGVWKATRDMVLALLTLAIIIIAFMNILSISTEQWGLTKMLPKLILGVLMVYASFIISVFLLDFMSALQALLLNASGGKYFEISSISSGILNPGVGDTVSAIGELIFLFLLGIALFLAVIWLVLVLVVRIAMLYIIVGVAPIAFAANILPWTEKYNKMWWGAFWKWAFMGPAVAFMLWLTGIFLVDGYLNQKYGTPNVDSLESWIWLIAAAVMVYLAATLPLKMGGEIYSAVMKPANGMGKNAWNKTGIPSFNAARKSEKERNAALRGQSARARIAQSGWLGRRLAGTDKIGANRMMNTILDEKVKGIEERQYDKKQAQGAYKSSSGNERAAMARYMAKNGWFDDGDKGALQMAAEDYVNDAQVRNGVNKEQGDLLSAMKLSGASVADPEKQKIIDATEATLRGKAGATNALKPAQATRLLEKNKSGQLTNKTELMSILTNSEKLKQYKKEGGDQVNAILGKGYAQLSATEVGQVQRALGDDYQTLIGGAVETMRTREATQQPGYSGEKLKIEHEIE